MFEPSNRLKHLPAYVFSQIAQQIRTLTHEGHDVIRLDIGSPDGMPPPQVLDTLVNKACQPDTHGYSSYTGIPAFRAAVASFYERRFGVQLDPDTQVLPLIGSKEGLANLSMGFLNEGDRALVPDIAYPVYERSVLLAGGNVEYLPLSEENGYLPDLNAIPESVAASTKMIWVNYPNNPTGAVASPEFYASLVSFCRHHHILLVSDNPYFDLTFDGYRAGSVLETPESLTCSVEFMSFSKSYNMGGWRLGAAVGNADILKVLLQMKSNVDTGHFTAIYHAGIAALEHTTAEWAAQRNATYERRRDLILEALPEIGLSAQKPRASMYVWARVNDGDGQTYARSALDHTKVSITPGSGFGPGGGRYVRFSLGIADDRLAEALERLKRWYAGNRG